MKTQINSNLASVIVVNFNNATFLLDSINSILKQSYKHIEIIVVDDKSTDNSLKILKNFKKKIIIIKNKKKTEHGSYNQINAYYKGFIKSKGNYIFFLDSDDFFTKDKIKLNIKELKKKGNNLIFDLPILKFKEKIKKKKFKQKNFLFSSWPRFPPQSCISLRREYALKIFKILKIKKFESIWFDFRIAIYEYLKNKKIKIFYKYLTYYRQLDNSASKNYKFFSYNWWYRRNQAHQIVSFYSKKLNVKNKITLDMILTKILFILIK